MSVNYVPVLWNRQKRRYDLVILGAVIGYLALFIGLTVFTNPGVTIEALILRSTGSLALVMLHVILIIGPLARLDARALPLLYNRRHLGVSMFLIAAIHGIFAIIQFHTLGDVNPLVSVFSSHQEELSLSSFPFQPLGFLALLILFVMASTSHDFWLKNLSPRVWKTLHMCVYLVYALIIGHVLLGILQYETAPLRYVLLGFGLVTVCGIHIFSALRDRTTRITADQGAHLVEVCALSAIPEDRARIVRVAGEEIAVFRYDGKVSAIHNLCKHQNGPLGEGKIIDGCITCPWHGYQYLPHNGCSPPPFTEKVHTYRVAIRGDTVYVDPSPLPEGTAIEPAQILNQSRDD